MQDASSEPVTLEKVIIGAPIGNYLRFAHTTRTRGSFTALYRGGFGWRVWRMLKTLRYYPGIRAWKNQLGLPNPGVHWLLMHSQMDALRMKMFQHHGQTVTPRYNLSHDIVSVVGHNLSDWHVCVATVLSLYPAAIELNVSCPNCPGADQSDYSKVFKHVAAMTVGMRTRLIVKLPPLGYMTLLRHALDAGIRSFHCSNTLPTPYGGISGAPLKPFALQATRDVHNYAHARNYDLDVLIGGGGIRNLQDTADFFSAGATNVAVCSVLLNPFNWSRIRRLAWYLRGGNSPTDACAAAVARPFAE